MRRFLDRLASLPIIFISGACEAQMVMVPCELPIAAMAPVHFAAHPVRHRHVAHRGGRRGAQHALHLVAGSTMCAAWVGEGETYGNLGDDFNHTFGGGSFENDGSAADLGGDEGGGGFGGGFGGGGKSQAPIFVVDFTPPLKPLVPPAPDCCGPTTPPPVGPPVPEPATWALMAIGLSALGFLKWRRA